MFRTPARHTDEAIEVSAHNMTIYLQLPRLMKNSGAWFEEFKGKTHGRRQFSHQDEATIAGRMFARLNFTCRYGSRRNG